MFIIKGLSAGIPNQPVLSEAVGIAWTSAWMTCGMICPDGERLIPQESIGGSVKIWSKEPWGPYFDPFVVNLKHSKAVDPFLRIFFPDLLENTHNCLAQPHFCILFHPHFCEVWSRERLGNQHPEFPVCSCAVVKTTGALPIYGIQRPACFPTLKSNPLVWFDFLFL